MNNDQNIDNCNTVCFHLAGSLIKDILVQHLYKIILLYEE
jgi:hypothetical protein